MGDDAAGMLVVQRLKTSLPADSFIIPIEGGSAPENLTGLIRNMHPGLVVFIDAGDIGLAPGSQALFFSNEAEGVSAFGHSLPLSVLGQYLEKEVGCRSLMLIIQPEKIDFDIPVSSPVEQAVETITAGWMNLAAEFPGQTAIP